MTDINLISLILGFNHSTVVIYLAIISTSNSLQTIFKKVARRLQRAAKLTYNADKHPLMETEPAVWHSGIKLLINL